ncbi:PapC protein [Escherichia coli]|uniref:PapC protein n=1 Tax=Escherichia coli TaxID=562 RepID=A0A376ML75_ECOLX|nr:PapC protein [Escherichia coli]
MITAVGKKRCIPVTLNKNVADWNTSFNLQYSRQTYWDIRKTDYYTVSVNRYFNVFGLQGVGGWIVSLKV